MNILTPAALEAAVDMVRDICPCSLARKEAEALFLSAFNAAIAKLIEEGRAKKGKFLNDASEPAFWDDGIFIKGEP